jgi:hypothetical protein
MRDGRTWLLHLDMLSMVVDDGWLSQRCGGAVPSKVSVTTATGANEVETLILDFVPMPVYPNLSYDWHSQINLNTNSCEFASFNFSVFVSTLMGRPRAEAIAKRKLSL